MKIAVVGGGASGLSCLWALRRGQHDVHLFESNSRLGGHADTNEFVVDGQIHPVDTAFIVMHKHTYPNFLSLLENLGVRLVDTDMSVGFSKDDGNFEWGSYSFWSFVPRLGALLEPSFWRMMFDLLWFNYTAYAVLMATPSLQDPFVSIGEFLRRQGYSQRFADDLLMPMVAAPWCTDPEDFAANFPAAKLIPFMHHHGLLATHSQSLKWHTIEGGSQTYVRAFENSNPPSHKIHLDSKIMSVRRRANGKIDLFHHDGSADTFDHVVLATHANQALRLLGEDASKAEKDILSSFPVSSNTCVLHSDRNALPKNSECQSAWNCLMNSQQTAPHHLVASASRARDEKPSSTEALIPRNVMSLTFDMNKLQHIPISRDGSQRALVTMNPLSALDPRTVQGTYSYDHPLITADSMRAEARLPEINGTENISFAGAWMRHGFHEDAVVAGLRAANRLLAKDQRTSVRESEHAIYKAPMIPTMLSSPYEKLWTSCEYGPSSPAWAAMVLDMGIGFLTWTYRSTSAWI